MADQRHILIVEARFYPDIADALTTGAVAALDAAGASQERIKVPGAFEIPAAIGFAVDSGAYDGYLALGCVIRGETSHYDYVCAESARGLADLALHRGAALGYGILTCETYDQALARAAVDGRNKGGDVAGACLAMVDLKRKFEAREQ
ncbi:MAG: 6,7-dimethyl-8-ribityllumazine synthase [Alphaproteobacteria bacterium]